MTHRSVIVHATFWHLALPGNISGTNGGALDLQQLVDTHCASTVDIRFIMPFKERVGVALGGGAGASKAAGSRGPCCSSFLNDARHVEEPGKWKELEDTG